MARSTQPKRFRLSFVGPIEDQPRLIRAYGRACDGEFALVMRPSEARAVLVLITKKDGAFVWRAGEDPADGRVHATATVVRDGPTKLQIEGGPHAGATLRPTQDLVGVEHGDSVGVTFLPGDEVAVVRGPHGDAPQRPESAITPSEAVKLIKAEQAGAPKPGPTTLRGRWTGHLTCDGGAPRVELRRKLATYGTLTIASDPSAGWYWSFERAEKWFGESGESAGSGLGTLSQAIEAGVLGAMSLVREACSFRDTRRRAAHDPAYATRHPIKAPKPMRNPTERLKVRDGRRKKAPPPKPLDEGAEVAPPETTAALERMVEVATATGDGLAELQGRTWLWQQTTPVSDIATWFDDHGFQGLAEGILDYAKTTTYPLHEFIAALHKDLRSCETVHDDDPDPAVYTEARRQLALLEATLSSTPAAMERARKLIRYAAAMARSPLCKGKEQREALAAAKRAADAYEDARAAILRGQTWDALKTLRRIGERVSLSAAKAARSCSTGQTSLTALVPDTPPKRMESAYNRARRLLAEADTEITKGHADHAREKLEDAGRAAAGLSSSKAKRIHDQIRALEAKLTAALTPEGWAPFAVGDRVALDGVHGQVSRVPGDTYAATVKVTFLADGRKRGRRVEARLLARVAPEVDAPVDAAKDQALVDAFSTAIAAALGAE